MGIAPVDGVTRGLDMLHIIGIVLLILAAWILLSVVAVLVLGVWLSRAAEASTGPATPRARTRLHGATRLAILPYIIESTAREQKRRREG